MTQNVTAEVICNIGEIEQQVTQNATLTRIVTAF